MPRKVSLWVVFLFLLTYILPSLMPYVVALGHAENYGQHGTLIGEEVHPFRERLAPILERLVREDLPKGRRFSRQAPTGYNIQDSE